MPVPDSVTVHEPRAYDLRGGGRIILVVDDDADVREIAAILLREAGYLVKEAANGPEACDILAAGAVSLALVDYAMPVMSGYRIRQPGTRDSAGPSGDLCDRRRRSHVWNIPLSDPIIMKPYTRAALLKAVRRAALPRA